MNRLVEQEKNQVILIQKITHFNQMTEHEYVSGYSHFSFFYGFF